MIESWAGPAGSSTTVCHLDLGKMPHWKTVKNLTLFAEEIIPRLRGGAPARAGIIREDSAQPLAK